GNFVLNASGNWVAKANQIADNPFPNARDLQKELYGPGAFYNNFVSIARNTGSGNYAISFTTHQSDGIVFGSDGYGRRTVRVNVDQNVSDKFRVSVSSSYAESTQDPVLSAQGNVGGGPGTPFWSVLMLTPSADVYGLNPDGSKYRYRSDP